MITSVYVPFFFVESYALKLKATNDVAIYLLAIMNTTSLFGRLLLNWLADKYAGYP